MTIYSIWPAFASVTLILIIAGLPAFGRVGFATNPEARFRSLDGARGFLALAVVLHHSVIYYRFLRDGSWVVPPSRFYTLSGQIGVACFFIITGYLFWGKVVRARGELDFPRLMMGRLFRLAPIYLLMTAAAIAINFFQSGGEILISPTEYVMQAAQNLSFGLFPFTEMNGHNGLSVATAGVTWTLQYEWRFYLSLPLLAVFATSDRSHLAFAAFCLLATLLIALIDPSTQFVLYSFFAAGMLCASLEKNGWVLRANPHVLSLAVVVIFLSIFLTTDTAYVPSVTLLLAGAAYFLIGGASIFGVLVSKPAVRLGEISYDLYLLQGIVLFLIFSVRPIKEFGLASDLNHWVVILVALMVLVIVSLCAHLLIERPAVDFGCKLQRRRESIAASLTS
ncbi:acyltransferase family protein [Rhizobium sp. RAF56]|uniref:acyltransferase family protein n=1 Tax=Rhizobium sp. RAF56 TaxID=3233062 RepID=UPI003F94F076